MFKQDNKFVLIFNTVKYLKAKQLFFQFWYRLKKVKRLESYYLSKSNPEINYLIFSDFLKSPSFADRDNNFNFLNQKVSFTNHIDWNFMDNGKLWNYNLHYANYVLQEDIPLKMRFQWLQNLHNQLNNNSKGLEAYPVSLRVINTIRLICRHKQSPPSLLKSVEAEANFLSKRIEFHLLGNHVLENAFALLMAGAFFNNKKWINIGHQLLNKQLAEQILDDGAHFELSPMYHQIILYRILELIDWYSKWDNKNEEQFKYYITIAGNMLAWLKNMAFANGDIPLMNDSANGITYNSTQLFEYAIFLGLPATNQLLLSSSGYRKFKNNNYECVVDVGGISANYQPGHGHADALSFILYSNGQPILVERGTSTYQVGEQRSLERSTAAHNTLVYNNLSQSQVWGGFRVGARAKVTIEKDTDTNIIASHDGYKKHKIFHQREFLFNEKSITINDSFISPLPVGARDIIVYFHVHPKYLVYLNKNEIIIGQKIRMKCINAVNLEQESYKFASQYNQYSTGTLIKVKIKSSLQTIIYLS